MPPALPEASFLCKCSDLDQLVLPRTDADLLAVLQTAVPVRIRVDALEVVMLVDMARLPIGGRATQGRLGVDGVHTGHIQGHRVEGGEHSNIWKDRNVIFTMAVAVRGYIYYQGNMEVWTAVYNGFGILSHTAV